MITDVFEDIGKVLASHFNSLPKLEELVGRLEAVAGQLEPVAQLVAPQSAKPAITQAETDIADAGAVVDAALTAAEKQRQAEAEASIAATRVPEAGTEPAYTAAEWRARQEAEASLSATKIAEPAAEPPAPSETA